MLHIFLNCGLRLSEIKNLNIEDINLNDDKFTIIRYDAQTGTPIDEAYSIIKR